VTRVPSSQLRPLRMNESLTTVGSAPGAARRPQASKRQPRALAAWTRSANSPASRVGTVPGRSVADELGVAAGDRVVGASSSGPTSTTTPPPSASGAKKSGACLRSPFSPRQCSQNGWGRKGDHGRVEVKHHRHVTFYPGLVTDLAAVRDRPPVTGQFTPSRSAGNDPTGGTRSNGRSQQADSGSRRRHPDSSTNIRSNDESALRATGAADPILAPVIGIARPRSSAAHASFQARFSETTRPSRQPQ
jgi:hypothetical protein